jgi:hypothetical protein
MSPPALYDEPSPTNTWNYDLLYALQDDNSVKRLEIILFYSRSANDYIDTSGIVKTDLPKLPRNGFPCLTELIVHTEVWVWFPKGAHWDEGAYQSRVNEKIPEVVQSILGQGLVESIEPLSKDWSRERHRLTFRKKSRD